MGLRKATAAAFDAGACEVARKLGATEAGDRFFPDRLRLLTRFGYMTVHAYTVPRRGKQSGLYSVYCRFEGDRDALAPAVQELGDTVVNRYSGKYNFHEEGYDHDLDAALAAFKHHLERVL